MKTRFVIVALMSLVLAAPAFCKTSKNTYPVSCSEMWGAVRDVLSVAENYEVQESNDTLMTATYKVKHAAHVTVSGAVLQRANHVALVSKGTECEMQVKSNYSGFEHDDSGDFRKRVEESFAKQKAATPSQPAQPEAPAK
ncbi:MAG TPA: hypothetical protein VJW96_01935 [Terriglobales bacterium]|jgi:hypothetical protein|nr:hypothetical protein [Terriglobales bacterium]